MNVESNLSRSNTEYKKFCDLINIDLHIIKPVYVKAQSGLSTVITIMFN